MASAIIDIAGQVEVRPDELANGNPLVPRGQDNEVTDQRSAKEFPVSDEKLDSRFRLVGHRFSQQSTDLLVGQVADVSDLIAADSDEAVGDHLLLESLVLPRVHAIRTNYDIDRGRNDRHRVERSCYNVSLRGALFG